MRVCRRMHIAGSSRSAYARQHRVFEEACEEFGFDPLGLSEDQLCMLAMHFVLHNTIASVAGYMSALQHYYNIHAAGKLPRGPAFMLFMQGLKRLFAAADTVVRAKAITVPDLLAVVRSVDNSSASEVCFTAEVVTAFFLALRTEDHVAGRLRWGDVYAQADGSVHFMLPPGKSTSEFRFIPVAVRTDELDLLPWLRRLAQFVPAERLAPHCPIFVSFKRTRGGVCRYWPVSRTQFTSQLKLAVRLVLNYNPQLYSGYSLRRGFVTAVMSAPAPPPVAALNRHAGWTIESQQHKRYFDGTGLEQALMPSASLL